MSNTKRTYEVLRPIGWLGSRLERGSKIELTDEQASAFSPDDIRLSEPDAAPVTTGDQVDAEAAVKPKRTRKAKK
jgi:hypothetical protein